MVGRSLGHYRVLDKLGEGGMGEVYRAQDTKLGREVALKVLPQAFARDPERLARFEREARVLASLNHPNIAAIYGFEQIDGVSFLVLELVPGENLKGPLPLEETLAVARQLAEALEGAHEKGVVHRDLKPANIKVTPDGKVKVLDFGLAKAFSDERDPADPGSRTLTADATRAGTILGTAAYMSPEQARGNPLDKRTDIWSFGCVVYEMLAGREVFRGDTITDTLAAVVGREPDWQALPETTPPAIRTLLGRCLHKDLRRRLHDIADARLELEEPLSPSPLRPIAVPPRRRVALVALSLLVAVAAIGIAAWSYWRLRTAPKPVTRLTVTLPPGELLAAVQQPVVAISPDGSRLVYAATRGGRTQLFLRRLDQFEAASLPGTEDATSPFFSSDGNWVGFNAHGRLKKVALAGGSPVVICDSAAGVRGVHWGSDDSILFTPGTTPGVGLWRVPAAGGTPEQLTTPDGKKGEAGHRWAVFLPGGKAALSTIWGGGSFDETPIGLHDLQTRQWRTLVAGGTSPRYAPTGHLVYNRSGRLMAAPFDLRRLQVTGRPATVLEGVRMDPRTGAAQFAFSLTGSLVYVQGSVETPQTTLVLVDRQGVARPLTQHRASYLYPRFSPDGRRVAVAISEGSNRDLWVLDLARDALTRLTFEGGLNTYPAWSPEGKRIVFRSTRAGSMNLYWKPADGSGAEERLTTSDSAWAPTSFSPDGKWLLFDEASAATANGIWVLPLEGERKPRPFLQTRFGERQAVFSPDGRWVAYEGSRTGYTEVFVQPFPGLSGKWQISTEGGEQPVWARDGRELFYRQGDRMMAVEVTLGASFSAGKPRVLFEGRYETFPGLRSYDIAPDGRGFLMLQTSDTGAPAQLQVVLNWFEELLRKTQ